MVDSPPATPLDKNKVDYLPAQIASEEPFTYTTQEEQRVYWKLNLIVLPLLFLGFYVFQLERGNSSNALTDGFLVKIGITQDQFNTGQSLLFIGIILLEIPSNYILQLIGPSIWISFQVLAFGLVSTFQAYQHDHASFLTTRVLLGVTECGYLPACLYTLSTFYRRRELATVTAIFYLGSNLATATSGLLAYGILPLGTRYPQYWGWQWLMLIEGIMAIVVAVLLFAFLPGSPTRPRPLFLPIRYFTEREEKILVYRVIRDDPAKADTARNLTMREVGMALSKWRIWVHLIMTMAYVAPNAAMLTYGPTVIRSFNFDTLTANALSSVPGWVLIFTTLFYARLSDKLNLRGPVVILALVVSLTFSIAFQQTSGGSDKWVKYAMHALNQGLNTSFHAVHATWISLNCHTPQERAITMAMFIMSANTGGLIGSQILRGDDAPLYPRGFRVLVGLTAFAVIVAVLQHIQYRLSNRRLGRIGPLGEEEEGESADCRDDKVAFRYTL